MKAVRSVQKGESPNTGRLTSLNDNFAEERSGTCTYLIKRLSPPKILYVYLVSSSDYFKPGFFILKKKIKEVMRPPYCS
jgi:hypothetical protein